MDDRTDHPGRRRRPPQTPMGLGVLPERQLFELSPLNRRRWQNFKANRRGYWSLWIFLVAVRALAVRRIHRQRQAVLCALRRQARIFPVFVNYPETAFGGDFETAADYRDPYPAEADRREGRLHALAADPLLLQHAQSRPADAGAVAADLDADRGSNASRWSSARGSPAAAISNTTGSAPTTRAATWWRA